MAVAKLKDPPTLTKGEKYWVTATTSVGEAALGSNWYGSNNAQVAFNLDDGDGWQAFTGGTPAFKVQGSGMVFSKAAADASHPAFGGNLFVDPCTGCNYNPDSPGFPLYGPANCTSSGTTTWLAVPFVAARSGIPKRISASIILSNPAECPQNKVTLSIYTDNCDLGPGVPLVSAEATVPTAAPCDLAVAKLRNSPALEKSVKYWVVATTSAKQSRLDASWYASNAAQISLNSGPGSDWIQFSTETPAFLVQ
jgi:hypothetical protein